MGGKETIRKLRELNSKYLHLFPVDMQMIRLWQIPTDSVLQIKSRNLSGKRSSGINNTTSYVGISYHLRINHLLNTVPVIMQIITPESVSKTGYRSFSSGIRLTWKFIPPCISCPVALSGDTPVTQ